MLAHSGGVGTHLRCSRCSWGPQEEVALGPRQCSRSLRSAPGAVRIRRARTQLLQRSEPQFTGSAPGRKPDASSRQLRAPSLPVTPSTSGWVTVCELTCGSWATLPHSLPRGSPVHGGRAQQVSAPGPVAWKPLPARVGGKLCGERSSPKAEPKASAGQSLDAKTFGKVLGDPGRRHSSDV